LVISGLQPFSKGWFHWNQLNGYLMPKVLNTDLLNMTMIISRILSNDVIKISGGIQPSSNVYLIKSRNALIDLGSKQNSKEIIRELKKYVSLENIDVVVFTHLHADHTGNPLIFNNAKFYASKEELDSLNTPLNFADTGTLKKINLNELKKSITGLKVIKSPGHTAGSICLWKEDDKILFTGDTLFRTGAIGRTDLPTSMPKKMKGTLLKLAKFDYIEIAPGHNLEHERIL